MVGFCLFVFLGMVKIINTKYVIKFKPTYFILQNLPVFGQVDYFGQVVYFDSLY